MGSGEASERGPWLGATVPNDADEQERSPTMPNYIQVACPGCDADLRVREEYLGKRGMCKYCHHDFRIPRSLRMHCPCCFTPLKVSRVHAGRRIACPACKQRFVAESHDERSSSAGNLSFDTRTRAKPAIAPTRKPLEYQAQGSRAPQERCEHLARGAAEMAKRLELGVLGDELEATRAELRERDVRLALLTDQLAEGGRRIEGLEADRRRMEGALAEAVRDAASLREEAGRLRAVARDTERSLAEVTDRLADSREARARAVEEARGDWEARQRDAMARRDLELRSIRDEAARRLAEEESRHEAERREQRDAFERERGSLLGQLRASEESADAGRDEALRRAGVEQELRDESVASRQALEEARQEVDVRNQRAESHRRRVAALENELRGERLEREREKKQHDERMTALSERLEAAQAEAARAARSVPAPPAHAIPPAPDRDELEAATKRCDRLAAELHAAHRQIAQLNHDLALSEYADLTAEFPEVPAAIDIADEMTAARERIEALLRERAELQQINHSLTAHLSSFGIQSKAL
jgi:uncharacterized Zn finger protein (UPF0148 family)